MKRLFLVIPREGRTKKKIKESEKKILKLAEAYFDTKFDDVSYPCAPDVYENAVEANEDILKTGDSISRIASCTHAIIVGEYGPYERDTEFYYDICRRFGIPHVRFSFRDFPYMIDVIEQANKAYEGEGCCEPALF